LVRIDSVADNSLNRFAGYETAQTGCCHRMAQDVSSSRESLISMKVVHESKLLQARRSIFFR
jgi:hypothetical protein